MQSTLLATTLGLGFAAGLRPYATILGLGLAIRFHPITLPASAQGSALAHPAVLAAAGAAFVIEFVSDKIPWVDSLGTCSHDHPAGGRGDTGRYGLCHNRPRDADGAGDPVRRGWRSPATSAATRGWR
ncbi:MAG: DUF4126 domain-containing protein [Bryobacterales bacterium]|nr:DUF4126 domain-containing protein [Bryobacterales bacterium]